MTERAKLSVADCQPAQALTYVRDVTAMDPDTPAADVVRLCIIDTATSYEVLAIMRAERERDVTVN